MKHDTSHPTSRSNNVFLGWFVVASVIAHGIFIAFTGNEADQTLSVNLSTPLMVTVVSSRSEAKPETQTATQKTGSTSKPLLQPLSVKKEKLSVRKNNKKSSVQAAKKAQLTEKSEEISADDKNNVNVTAETATALPDVINVKNIPLNHLRQQLKQAIKARFTYPRMARRMGWEGLVGISLHIEDDGSLNQIHIARSSGHKLLDENARKTIQNIGRIHIASNLTIQASNTEIEVLYKLTD